MKLTVQHLRKIILEQANNLSEGMPPGGWLGIPLEDWAEDAMHAAAQAAEKHVNEPLTRGEWSEQFNKMIYDPDFQDVLGKQSLRGKRMQVNDLYDQYREQYEFYKQQRS